MSVKLKSVTKTAWLVINDHDNARVGLLTEIRNQYVLMVAGQKKNFLDRKEVNNFFKQDVFNGVPQFEITVSEYNIEDKLIDGYYVNFRNPIKVEVNGNKLPLFKKKENSDVLYSAGFYCFKFPREWLGSVCPKLTTLERWEHVGPFKTKDEMKLELSKLRKTK